MAQQLLPSKRYICPHVHILIVIPIVYPLIPPLATSSLNSFNVQIHVCVQIPAQLILIAPVLVVRADWHVMSEMR